MPLIIQHVDLDRIEIKNTSEGPTWHRHSKATARRMFTGIAIVTREEIENLIAAARAAPEAAVHDLEDLYREFFE